jgi:magnesium chelatase subunit I
VKVEYDDRVKISEICSELDVDGLRGDMVRTCCRIGLSAAAVV